nr:MAG TPA: hypothetical protein [Caudoviricetes sp.]
MDPRGFLLFVAPAARCRENRVHQRVQLSQAFTVCGVLDFSDKRKIPRSFHETTRDFLGGVGGI